MPRCTVCVSTPRTLPGLAREGVVYILGRPSACLPACLLLPFRPSRQCECIASAFYPASSHRAPILPCAIPSARSTCGSDYPRTLPRPHPCLPRSQPSHPGIVIASVRLRDAPPPTVHGHFLCPLAQLCATAAKPLPERPNQCQVAGAGVADE